MKKSADKGEDLVEQKETPRETRERSGGKPQPTGDGPAVFKVSKGRKLVAAGTADEVEIEMELETAETDDKADKETTES